MMPPLPPIAPILPRECFRTDAEYRAALAEHEAELRARDEAGKDSLAMLILMTGLFSIVGIVGIGAVLYTAMGWRGPAYALAVSGLMWVAYIQIRRRL